MHRTLLLIRAAAIRAIGLFNPPEQVRDRAAYAAEGVAMATAAVDAGPHGSPVRSH
jgi:hypothetical protein